MKRVSATLVHNEGIWLKFVLDGIYETVDQILIAVNALDWSKKPSEIQRTLYHLRSYPDPDNKIIYQVFEDIASSTNGDLAGRMNELLDLCTISPDFMYYIDVDEIREAEEFKKLDALICSLYEKDLNIVCSQDNYIYFKDVFHRIMEPNQPRLLCTYPWGKKFISDRRMLGCSAVHYISELFPDAPKAHHFSFVRSDAQMKAKQEIYETIFGKFHDGWWEECWENFNDNTINVYPWLGSTYPSVTRVGSEELPIQIQKALEDGTFDGREEIFEEKK